MTTPTHTMAETQAPARTRHWTRSDADPYRILVVDDNSDVAPSFALSLRGAVLDGRAIVVERANSGLEARRMLEARAYALAIVDVVMESEAAGLDLVRWLTKELKDDVVRVVVNTGNPMKANELLVPRDNEISGYCLKGNQHAAFIHALVVGHCRSYRDLVRAGSDGRAAALAVRALRDGGTPADVLGRFAVSLCVEGVAPEDVRVSVGETPLDPGEDAILSPDTGELIVAGAARRWAVRVDWPEAVSFRHPTPIERRWLAAMAEGV